MNKFKTKKPIYEDLALYLGVSKSAIQQYNPKKRALMILGLWVTKERDLKAKTLPEEKTTLF